MAPASRNPATANNSPHLGDGSRRSGVAVRGRCGPGRCGPGGQTTDRLRGIRPMRHDALRARVPSRQQRPGAGRMHRPLHQQKGDRIRMRVHIRRTGAPGDPLEADDDLPDTIQVGDSFILGGEGDQEVAIVGIKKASDLTASRSPRSSLRLYSSRRTSDPRAPAARPRVPIKSACGGRLPRN